MRPIHDRMPVILPIEAYGKWLEPSNQDVDALQALLQPYPAKEMAAHPVSTWVNNPRHEGQRCIEAVN